MSVNTREELKSKLSDLGIQLIKEESHDAVDTCEAQVHTNESFHVV